MNTIAKQELLLAFINGPLKEYLSDDTISFAISFGRFVELTNEICGTNFSYSDLYTDCGWLFNAQVHYPANEEMLKDLK